MALNKFPTYEELRKNSPEVLSIVESSVGKKEILKISWYPWTWKTLVSWMMFAHCTDRPKVYLTFAHMLVAYTKQWIWVKDNIYTLDSYLYRYWEWARERGWHKSDDEWNQARINMINRLNPAPWTILFIDEAQDISTEVVAKLSLKFDSVVICWDKDQTIYEKSNAWADFFQDYENALRRNPGFDYMLDVPDIGHLKKNYRNTPPIFEFANCFQPDAQKIKDIQIMRKWWVKPQLWIWDEKDVLDELITFCINNIESQWIVWIIVDNKKDVPYVYEYLKNWIRHGMGSKFEEWMLCNYASSDELTAADKKALCDKCMNANVIVSTIHSMKWLEFDNVVFWKIWQSSWRSYDSISRNRYYVWMTRAKDRLIICQENEWFWNYSINSNLYDVHNVWVEEVEDNWIFDDYDDDDDDEYDELPF